MYISQILVIRNVSRNDRGQNTPRLRADTFRSTTNDLSLCRTVAK